MVLEILNFLVASVTVPVSSLVRVKNVMTLAGTSLRSNAISNQLGHSTAGACPSMSICFCSHKLNTLQFYPQFVRQSSFCRVAFSMTAIRKSIQSARAHCSLIDSMRSIADDGGIPGGEILLCLGGCPVIW